MNAISSQLHVVGSDGLPDYPISSKDRLDSHFFLQWNLKRFRGSAFRKLVDPEAGWYGFQLFCIAQDGTPIGTLPCDERELAHDLNLPLEKWQALMGRDISPLYGWSQVMCDNGEIRLAHPVVTEVAQEALKSKRRNQEDSERRKLNKRLKDLSIKITMIGAQQLLQQAGFLEKFNDWLDEKHPNEQRRETLVRRALDAFLLERAP